LTERSFAMVRCKYGHPERWLARFELLALLSGTLICWPTMGQPIQPPGALSGTSPSVYDQQSEWTDDNGDKLRLDKWRGSSVIIAMAYTECTRICAATLHRLEEAQTLADKLNTKVDFIVVSFDPGVDNPESWSYYRKQHHLQQRNNWHFLTGTTASTRKLANQLGIEYWFDENHIMHDMKILYLNPDGQVKTYLDWDHQDVNALFK
jgi:cytochrome oxidase Cu insertion factor (SCO1/SenC/PrrC family)